MRANQILASVPAPVASLAPGAPGPESQRGRVVDYRHVLPSLRGQPMALLNWVCRDDLFPRDAYRRAFNALLEALGGRKACRRMVDLLALAHDQCCEAQLAAHIDVLARRREAARCRPPA